MVLAAKQGARDSRSRSARVTAERDDADRHTRRDRENRQSDAERLGEEVGAFEGAAHNIANDVNALVQAWSEANAEVVKGLVSVVGNLVVDLNQSIGLTGRRGDRRPRKSSQRDDADADRDDIEDTSSDATRISRTLSDVVKGTANVIQRSGQRFQRRFERVERGDDEADEEPRRHRARGERDNDPDRSEEARERQYRDTVQQRDDDVAADQQDSVTKTKP